jgi:hypothetical protein
MKRKAVNKRVLLDTTTNTNTTAEEPSQDEQVKAADEEVLSSSMRRKSTRERKQAPVFQSGILGPPQELDASTVTAAASVSTTTTATTSGPRRSTRGTGTTSTTSTSFTTVLTTPEPPRNKTPVKRKVPASAGPAAAAPANNEANATPVGKKRHVESPLKSLSPLKSPGKVGPNSTWRFNSLGVPKCPLPCRETQFEEIWSFLNENISQKGSR